MDCFRTANHNEVLTVGEGNVASFIFDSGTWSDIDENMADHSHPWYGTTMKNTMIITMDCQKKTVSVRLPR
jgi:hypothetical protein